MESLLKGIIYYPDASASFMHEHMNVRSFIHPVERSRSILKSSLSEKLYNKSISVRWSHYYCPYYDHVNFSEILWKTLKRK